MPGNPAHDRADIRAVLDAWREQGADRLDPLRFGVIAALERRAHRYDGPVRDLLQDRLAALMAEYASALVATATPGASTQPDIALPPGPQPGEGPGPAASPLRALLDHFGASPAAVDAPSSAEDAGAASAVPVPRLSALEEFQQLWGRLRTDSQLRQSLASVPEGAGPLHSSTLLHRAMTLMHEASPGYLQHFVAYVDALSWMEQLQGADVVDTKAASRTGNITQTKRPRSRKSGA